MCGIAGAFNGTVIEVEEMLNRIIHRGPDGKGITVHNQTIHGHVRLALVDLTEASAQPFKLKGSSLTFNGELWNYRKLRSELQDLGFEFKTTGDTEVLAATLDCHGINGLHLLDGMFAFAWSSSNNEHWLVRDAFGKIPVYIAKTKKGFLWASERKAFPNGLKPIAIPPGHAFNLVTGKWLNWYKAPKHQQTDHTDVLKLLEHGVQKRLAADAPVCCLISGGLDSSIILALAKQTSRKVTAFTAVFDSDSDDLKSARKLCSELEVKLIEVPVGITDQSIQNAISSIEISSKAQIEIAMLCIPLAQRIYAEGFRACLSGEAADELFGGYGNFCIQASKATESELIKLRHAQLNKMSRGNFVRCNKAFMAAGVECRLPFMEQELVERVIQLNKAESPLSKGLLKKAAEPLLPKWVINRTKDTFQGGSGVARFMQERVASPTVFYNAELRKKFGYLPKD
jgi:asparagine synthase (glutamine-hydrolysing)